MFVRFVRLELEFVYCEWFLFIQLVPFIQPLCFQYCQIVPPTIGYDAMSIIYLRTITCYLSVVNFTVHMEVTS